jgi:hypothetical protein
MVIRSSLKLAPTNARPEVPSRIQGLLAADQPVGRVVTAGCRFGERVPEVKAAVLTNRVNALEPPQMVRLLPEHFLLQFEEVALMAAPLARLEPQKHSEEYCSS